MEGVGRREKEGGKRGKGSGRREDREGRVVEGGRTEKGGE